MKPSAILCTVLGASAAPSLAPSLALSLALSLTLSLPAAARADGAVPGLSPPPATGDARRLTDADLDRLATAIARCWNVSNLSTAAAQARIALTLRIGPDKRPVSGSILLARSDVDAAATRQAFEAARRAILRCGANGLPLPDGKEATWGQLELIFDKGRVGL